MASTFMMKAFILCGMATLVTSPDIPLDLDITAMAANFFKEMDYDRDGSISLTDSFNHFDRYDKNKDGIWTVEEYSKLPPRTPLPPPLRGRFLYYDAFDGIVDNQAHRSRVEELFRNVDKNEDNSIDKSEFRAFFSLEIRPSIAKAYTQGIFPGR